MGRQDVARQLNACLDEIVRGFVFYLRETLGPGGRTPFGDKLAPEVESLLEEFFREDDKHVTDLIDAIEALGDKASFATYAMKNFYFNYLIPEYLARTLVDHLEEDAKAFESAARPLEKDLTVGALVRAIAADKKQQFQRLRNLNEKRATQPA